MNRPRPNRPLPNTTVVETAQLTPHMVRIIVEGPELDEQVSAGREIRSLPVATCETTGRCGQRRRRFLQTAVSRCERVSGEIFFASSKAAGETTP
jgi:NADPH-dependent ferric siderophore reductase